MKALTWKQPFASLMVHGKIETRTWKTNVRGKVLICASKVPYNLNQVQGISGDYQLTRIMNTLAIPDPGNFGDLDCGFAIAIGNLVDCRPMKPTDEDDCFVLYNPSAIVTIDGNGEHHYPLWCHIYEDVRAIVPIPFKGKQGWSEVNQNILDQIFLKKVSQEKFF